jgi:regulator of sirC expression with transglutaminase-like and TPR domain
VTAESRERFRAAAARERVDLALLCLLVGAEAAPGGGEAALDAAQIALDELAGRVPVEATAHGDGSGPDPRVAARALQSLLGEQCGFHGTPSDYRRLESSLLQSVLLRRRGLPILLSVVWIEVGRRAGVPVHGVGLPGHFVVGFGDPAGDHVLADPFDGGRLLSGTEAELLVARATGGRGTLTEAVRRPTGPLEIVLRVLRNIDAWAAARPERSDVRLWALDLALLLPHRPAALRRERAELLVERGDFRHGAAALEEYADAVEPADPDTAQAVRRQAHAARARLN